MSKFCNTIVACLLAACITVLRAQDSIPDSLLLPLQKDLVNLKIESEVKQKVNVSSLADLYLYETPGIVCIVTEKDIETRAYSDLLDIFMDIPGFNINSDVQNGVGLSLRGFWTGEAKLLVMIDGMMMNELAYGSFVLGNRIPVSAISRVEVMKGAGSNIYGNYAGLGVINIVTKNPENSRGTTLTGTSGLSNGKPTDNRISFESKTRFANDVSFSVSASLSVGRRSNETTTSADGAQVNMADSSGTLNSFIRISAARKAFYYDMLYDYYTFAGTFEPIISSNSNMVSQFGYRKKFKNGTIHTRIKAIKQQPWLITYGDPTVYSLQNILADRVGHDFNFSKQLYKWFHVNAGTETYIDRMKVFKKNYTLSNGKYNQDIFGMAAFGEASFFSRYANFFAGIRADKYYRYKTKFSPRIAITKEFKKFYYKVVTGQSYKIPTLQNINISYNNAVPLTPEIITDLQSEIGIKMKKGVLSFNVYRTKIKDIITYGYDLNTFVQSYVNSGNMTVNGIEFSGQLGLWRNFSSRTGFSLYFLNSGNATAFIYDTLDLRKGTIGIPGIKLCQNLQYTFKKNYLFQINYIYTGERRSVEMTDAVTEQYNLITRLPIHLIDFIASGKFFKQKFLLGLGIKNILNSLNPFVYPSTSGYAAIFGRGREMTVYMKLNI